DITYVWGQLEVTVRPITIETGSASKVYDGTALSDTSYTITDGSLATNQTIEIIEHSSITNVGSTDNLFVIEIWDHASQDVSSNYDITFVHGTLSISPRPVTITSATDTKVYDGVVFSNDEVLVTEGTIANEQTIVVLSSATILNVGTRSNTFTMEIHDALDQDVTANYDITFVYGVLEITPRVITIQTNSNSKVYDGTPLSDSGFSITDGSLAEEQSFVFVDGVSITNVGVIDNVLSIEIHNVFNENVISNYDITYVYGTLEVTPRPITIESATDQKIYDVTPLSNSNVTIISGSLVEGHILTVTDSNAITNVGYDGNPFHITITDDQLVDMIGNYTVSYHLGSLTVLPRPITIETSSNEKFYDGTPLSDSTYELVTGTLAEGQSIQVIDSSTITEVGIIDNEFFLKIFDSENEDVTSNYELTWTLGTLEILKREVWLTSDSAEKTYDGTPLSQPTVSILDGQLVPGHTIGTYNFTSYVGPGNTTNILSVDIFDTEGRNVTSSYEIHLEYGVLVVQLIEIVVTTPDDTKIYDGTPLTNSNWELTSGALLQGHDLYVSVTGTITDIGQTFNRFTYYILDENSVDVTQYYQVSENIGILEVISGKEDLILKSGTDSKDYDGTPLTKDSWEFIECELLPGHTITVTVTGTITEVGETDNVFTFQIWDEANQDVTDTMYNVTPVYGNLTIFDGDGNGSNQDSSIEITPEGWFEGASNSDGTLFKINSEVSGLIYLRQRSFGDYNKTGWDAPIVYESPYGISPFLFPYLASQGEVSSYLIQLRAYVRGLSYYLPYFATDGIYDNINDVYASHSYGIGYDINYIPQGELDYTAYSLEGTDYEAYELEYRDFVYQHYLQLPADTEYELLKIASQNGLDASSATIIEDVQNFVLNAAVYNLQYKPFPENSDYVIYFLEQAHEGICQHFAMAATLMYRAMGIPARYVVGYVTAAGANEWVDVSTKQAHAWTEIYIDGFGWVQIETTPSAAGTTGGMAFDMKMTSFDSKKETLVITSADASKTYDGFPLTNELYRFEGTLQSGHTLVVDGFASITKVGEIDNEFSVHVEDAQGNDVSNLYDLVSVYGKLYVMPDNGFEIIEIKLYDNTVTYDGTLHTATTAYYIPSRNLPAGYTVSFEVYGQIQNVGVVQTAINRPTLRIFNELGADVTNQYNIAFYDGSIKVAPRSITVALIPVQQYYDGTELTSDLFYIAKGSLVSGDTISITVSGSIIEVGIEDNRITDVTILNGEGVDVTNNYKVTTKDSTLTVLPD
ncbi:MAG: transglutaminase domain-containing protein, partial [Candidatus Izemoplasmatales bacterium]|nr:transglutaminase domain-containing protein [Candidatus Izemoplasmatales bacterium]